MAQIPVTTDATLQTSDITTGNVSTSKHGFAPKAPNDVSQFLDGTGAYSTPTSAAAVSVNFCRNYSFSFAQRQVPTTYTTPQFNNVTATTTVDGYGADCWKAGFQTATMKHKLVDTNGAQESGLQSRFYSSWQQQTNAGKFQVYQALEGSNTYDLNNRVVSFQIKLKASGSKTIRLGAFYLTSSGTMDTIPAAAVSSTSWGANSTDPTLGTNLTRIVPSSVISGAQGTVNGNALDCSVTTAWQIFGMVFTVPATAKNLILAVWTDSQFSTNDILSTAEADLHVGAYLRQWLPEQPAEYILDVQRYCFGWGGTALYERIGSGVSTTTNAGNGIINLPATMRVTPSIGYNSISNMGGYDQRTGVVTTLNSLTTDSTGNTSRSCNYDFGIATTVFTAGDVVILVTNNTTSAIFYLDADL